MSFEENIKRYSKSDVDFTKHAMIKLSQMTFDETFIIDTIFDIDKLLYEEYQELRKTYKLIFEHSKKYSIAIVVALNKKINVVTFYKTSKKIQKLIKERGVVHIFKKLK